MKVVGTICEYNPFHNGHLYHLQKIKEISKCDILVVVLSTYFTMRGELSIHSPFDKTKYALSEADIVISLPSILAVNSADKFAFYAVRELNKIGVTELYFGSETNDTAIYKKYEEIFNSNQNIVKEELKKGESYKKATSKLYNLMSNDLLGFAYYKAIKDNNYKIEIKTIKRIGDIHGVSEPIDLNYTSSSAIRKNLNLIDKYSPSFVDKTNILDSSKLFTYFKFLLINLNNKEFSNLNFLSEGIENLIIKNIYSSHSFIELIDKTTNKRYTSSRIRRAIFNMLFLVNKFDDNYQYTRVLGYSSNGKKYLNLNKKKLNILTNIKENICYVLDSELKIAKVLDNVYNTNFLSLEQSKPQTIENNI